MSWERYGYLKSKHGHFEGDREEFTLTRGLRDGGPTVGICVAHSKHVVGGILASRLAPRSKWPLDAQCWLRARFAGPMVHPLPHSTGDCLGTPGL